MMTNMDIFIIIFFLKDVSLKDENTKFKLCWIYIFIFCFHFLFSFSENMFGLTSCFLLSRNKNTENAFSKENLFLDLLKITFWHRVLILPKKWGSWFKLKTRFYYFESLIRFGKYFQWEWKQKSNQTYSHHHFLFSMRMKTENIQTKYPLNAWN